MRLRRFAPILLAIVLCSFNPISAVANDDCPAIIVAPFVIDCPQTPGCTGQKGCCVPRAIDLVLFGVGIRFCRCTCPDATIQANFETRRPIISFPATRVFHPSGTWTISGVSQEPLTVTAEGSMTVRFALDPRTNPPIVRATIISLSLQVAGLPTGDNEVHLLSTEKPFIGVTNTQTGEARLIAAPSLLLIDPADGSTNGVVGTLFSAESGSFSFKGAISGALDFKRGSWSWNVDGTQCPVDPPPGI
jgi:hypothetical protein